MSRQNYIFTSESVSEGHPDKVCDRISDAVLDAFLNEEPEARVACETFATTDRVVIGGEVGLSDQEKLHDYMGKIEEIARARSLGEVEHRNVPFASRAGSRSAATRWRCSRPARPATPRGGRVLARVRWNASWWWAATGR